MGLILDGKINAFKISCSDFALPGIFLFKKGDVLLEFSSVKWVLNEDHSLYSNLLGTLLLQNFVLDNSYFINFFVGQTTVEIEGIQKNWH